MMKKIALFIFLLFLNSPVFANSEQLTLVTVMFGQSIPDGSLVTEKEWNTFVQGTIVKNFPGGFTIVNAKGYWQDTQSKKTQAENTKLLYIVMPNSKLNLSKIKTITESYEKQFKQQSVLSFSQSINH